MKQLLLLIMTLAFVHAHAQNIGIGTGSPTYKLDIRSGGLPDLAAISIGTSSLDHQLVLFGGSSIDPFVMIRWKSGDDLKFATDEFLGISQKMVIKSNGNVGIGTTNPTQLLDVNGTAKMLTATMGTGIVSGDLTIFGNTNFFGNPLVNGSFGLIRSNDADTKRISTNTVTVNIVLGAGATTNIPFTFSQAFAATPEVYLGASSGGGFAEVVMTLAEVTSSGGKLFVFNPRGFSVNPSFTIKVVSIGP